MENIFKILIGCVFLIMGFYIIYRFTIFYIKSLRSLKWISVEGIVIESEYFSILNGDIPDEEYKIKYKYNVADKEYFGSRLFFRTFDGDNKNYKKKFPIGKSIKVFYNPNDFKDCVLFPGLEYNIYYLIPIGLIAILIGLLILLLR
jgi:hypothetical protein